jgi:hypothetical protein
LILPFICRVQHLMCSDTLLLLYDLSVADVTEQLSTVVLNEKTISIANGQFGALSDVTLLYKGVTFTAKLLEQIDALSTYKPIFCNVGDEHISCALAIDLGDNVKGGETIAPIIKGLLSLARRLGQATGAVAVIWRPARILSGFSYFMESVQQYEEGGVFPVLALVDFDMQTSGNIVTKGLNWFSEQELTFVAPNLSRADAMRRVVRIVHDIATNGPVLSAIEVGGLDVGEVIKLIPNETGNSLMMHTTSIMEH